MLQRVPESFKSIKDVSEDSKSFQKGSWIVQVFQGIKYVLERVAGCS